MARRVFVTFPSLAGLVRPRRNPIKRHLHKIFSFFPPVPSRPDIIGLFWPSIFLPGFFQSAPTRRQATCRAARYYRVVCAGFSLPPSSRIIAVWHKRFRYVSSWISVQSRSSGLKLLTKKQTRGLVDCCQGNTLH